jgi:hypothetical protein
MSKKRIIILLGVLTTLLPLSGFPSTWRSFFTFIFGVAITGLAFVAYKNKDVGGPLEKKEDSFTENTAPLFSASNPSLPEEVLANPTEKTPEVISSI